MCDQATHPKEALVSAEQAQDRTVAVSPAAAPSAWPRAPDASRPQALARLSARNWPGYRWCWRQGRAVRGGLSGFAAVLRLLLLVCLFGSSAVSGAEYIEERAWFEDASGQLGLSEVRKKPFQPYTGVLSRGFGEAPLWIRLKIRGSVQANAQQASVGGLVLRITPAHIDQIAMFDDVIPSSRQRLTGDRYAWNQDEYQSLFFNFDLPHWPTDRYVWLRVKTSSIRSVHVDVQNVQASRRIDMQLDMVSGAYLGCMVLFFGWALSMHFIARERLLALFVLKQGAAVVFTLFSLGYMRILMDGLLSPDTIHLATNIWFLVYTLVALLYHWAFMREFNPPAWLLKLFGAIALLFPLTLVMMLSGYVRQALQLNLSGILLAGLLAMVASWCARGSDGDDGIGSLPVPRRTMIAAHLLIFASLMVSIMAAKGLVFSSPLTLYTPLLHGLISGLLMMYLLQIRARRLSEQQARVRVERDTLLARVDTERAFREDQQHLLAMLAHELKTPISVIRMLLGSKSPTPQALGNVQLAINDMTMVVDRCLQVGQLSDAQQLGRSTRFDPWSLLQRLVTVRQAQDHTACEGQPGLTMQADEQMVGIVLGNLLENAWRYRAQNTPVQVRLTREVQQGRAGVCFTVENAPGAAGFPDPERVFSKYYRSPQAHRQSGSGLGLYLVHGFTRRLGGSVFYLPTHDRVRFSLWLPL